jgi:HK97 family phage portal protein
MKLTNVARTIMGSTPVPYSNRSSSFNIFQKAPNATEAQLKATQYSGTLYAVINGISETVSEVNWCLYRKATRNQRPEDRQKVYTHQALKVLNRPNPYMTRQEFMEALEQHIDLTGEGWWVVNSVGPTKIPVEMWLVRPDRMQVVEHPTQFISGYIYKGPDGEDVPLRKDQVVMIRIPNPYDPIRGMGPVQSILVDVDSARYGAEWNRNFFINGAEPGGIIEMDTRLDDEEFAEMEMRWRETHQGVANAHRVAILEQGKWVERKFSQRDMQFVELRKVSSEVIREAFRFPKALMGTVEDVNKANAEAAETHFARYIVKPRLERIKQALNNDFLPLFGTAAEGLEFDYENPIPDDRQADNEKLTAAANAAKTLRDAGWNEDDVLATVGLPPMRYSKPAQPKSINPPNPNVETEQPDEDSGGEYE